MASKIRVVVTGACGRMGQEVVRSVLAQPDMQLVGAVDVAKVGEDVGAVVGSGACGVPVKSAFKDAIAGGIDVLVDFTRFDVAPGNLREALQHGIACVVGTTGLPADDMNKLDTLSREKQIPIFIAPNFSLGAVLMMMFARTAARHFEWAEITELHHEKKADAPSGTAIRTAEMMLESRTGFSSPPNETLKIPGVRGGVKEGIRIHSVRLPGFLAHQEVLFGADGEVLTIRHDSTNRTSFMPGVMLSIRRVRELSGVVVGLEKLLDT
ncbi:MAG: 4-hydroxy-tetrahydrodipicolinate reductase [Candidatus Xenobia bacterium]